MDAFRISGGARLEGTVRVKAAKNAVLPILAACMLTREEVVLRDVPDIGDVNNMVNILRALGCGARREGDTLILSPTDADGCALPDGLSKTLRSSLFLLGPLLGRFRRAEAPYPGGCEIGQRPIDLHLMGLRCLGAHVTEEHGRIVCSGEGMRGGRVLLDFPSVGATENVMMAAVLLDGETVIRNAAREPEVEDLQDFLCSLGAKIRGGGTDTIRVEGVERLHGGTYRPIADRIAAGTILAAAAATRGHVFVEGARREHMESPLGKLAACGCIVTCEKGGIAIRADGALRPQDIHTQPYPGFPTDLQSPWMSLCACLGGSAVIVEDLFESRFSLAAELRRMGADIRVERQTALVRGGDLFGARVCARDLRGGAALTVAALAAEGVSVVENAMLIDRGYEHMEDLFQALGADVRRIQI